MVTPQDVLKFWFQDLKPQDHFEKNPEIDKLITLKFSSTVEQALKGELFSWRIDPMGRLAEIVILDQFTRNIYRDSPNAFIGDSIALTLAQEAVTWGFDRDMALTRRAFIYMPFMHSESKLIHEHAVKLFSQPGLESSLKFELVHKKIIDQFGRYPHRNAILGRTSTPEEIEFLKGPGSSF